VPEFKNILIAVDTSKESELVITRATELASKYQSQIYIIHVVEPVILESNYDLVPVINSEIEHNLVARGERFLETLEKKFNVRFEQKLIPIGSTKAEIHQAAKHYNIDLIVLGSHGRHGVARLLGSTANAVLHGAPCDVMCIKVGN